MPSSVPSQRPLLEKRPVPSRRILAIVLPELLCEVAAETLLIKGGKRHPLLDLPLAVITPGEGEKSANSVQIRAVNAMARRFGVTAGQTVVEASALLSRLVVREVSRKQAREALVRVAEVALEFGRTVSIELAADESEAGVNQSSTDESIADTVWVDITGSAHLRGGEQALAEELEAQIRGLGHQVRVAIADGKWLSRAFARWGHLKKGQRALIVPSGRAREHLANLPVIALPLSRETSSWLVRLGILNIEDLTKLPKKSVTARLGERAQKVLDLCEGHDDAPLIGYEPSRTLLEEKSWDEPAEGIEPLRFVLRGLSAKLSARLNGRGHAAQAIELTIQLDRGFARLRGIESIVKERFELSVPLWRDHELFRITSSRLERLKLGAPSVGLSLGVPKLTEATGRQLDLSRVSTGVNGYRGLEELPILLSELGADIGKHNVGILAIQDDHRPEAKSRLASAASIAKGGLHAHPTRGPRKARPRTSEPASEPTRAPTRLLPVPLPLDAPLKVGSTLSVGRQLYSIEKLSFERRLDAVEWWARPTGRDYLRLWLEGPRTGLSALVYVERKTGKRYLQAIFD